MKKDYNISVGKKIFKSRKSLNMTRAELGSKVDLHESTVKRYEDGMIKSLDIDKICDFANALMVTPQYLMGWEKETSKEVKETAGKYTVETKFTKTEIECFNKFRFLDEHGRKVVEAVLTLEYERSMESAYKPYDNCPTEEELEKLCVDVNAPDRAVND